MTLKKKQKKTTFHTKNHEPGLNRSCLHCRKKRSLIDIPQNVLTPETVDELPIALPVFARPDEDHSFARQRRDVLEIEEPSWIEKLTKPLQKK